MFTRENEYDSIVVQAGEAWSVDPALIKAIIGAESEFTPEAFRAEPKIGDASYGLMQLLYGTARLLGYAGPTNGLYDPTTNIRLGTRYLADLIKTAENHGHGVDSAVSAYNAGFSAVRPGDGKRVTNDAGADFINQAYVDRVLSLASYFKRGSVNQLATVTTYAKPAVENVSLWSLLSFAIPLLVFLIPKRHR